MSFDLTASFALRAHRKIVRLWHGLESRIRGWEDACRLLPLPKGRIQGLCASIARINTYQWHEEDKARDTQASDRIISAVKRNIDRSNQRRVDAIEELDLAIEQSFREKGVRPAAALPLSSETPGSMVDRISILVLKLYHMEEQRRRRDITEGQRRKFSERVRILKEQSSDLSGCLDQLLRDVRGRRRRFKTYFQLKMYNDPETNPYIKRADGRGTPAASAAPARPRRPAVR